MKKKDDLLYGLILAGGRSKRMGMDKGRMKWHSYEQRYYLYDLLEKFCKETFISCRKEQLKEIPKKYKTITDTFFDLNQYGALLSAMTKFPERSWLVVACDLPFINSEALEHLIANRDPSKIATAFYNSQNNLPEPLIAIWEARSKDRLLELLDQGVICPRKALIKSSKNVKLVKPKSEKFIINVNSPEDIKNAGLVFESREAK